MDIETSELEHGSQEVTAESGQEDSAMPAADESARAKKHEGPKDVGRGVEKKKKKKKVFFRSIDSTRIENFQVIVKIHKARNLSGNNVKPLVRVKCGDLPPQATHRKNGSDVSWDKTMVFTLRGSMSNVKDYLVEIIVLDSQRLRSDNVIGSFKLDLGNVYDQENHSYIRKWLLLTNLQEFDNRPQGYLKFTICLLGAGDLNPLEGDDGENNGDDDEDDVQNNLLMPVGADLRTVLFVLRVYKAEDLPQMDWTMKKKAKNMVDPYITFSFCGISKRTSTVKKNASPEWNEQLVVPVKVPSFCETLKLDLMDHDFLDIDELIGSVSIPLSSVCLEGYDNDQGGFLPTFGPSFINIYGSSVNQSHIYDKYCGRVLVELTTLTEEFDYHALETQKNISEQVMYQYENYMKKKPCSEYCLVIAFQEASMIEKTDNRINFHVSMGNYSTSFSSDLELFLSTDNKKGPKYYYLPWGSKKPIIALKSKWENIEFRYRTLNLFLKEVAYMEKAIKLLEEQDSLREHDDSELAVRVIHMIDEAIEFCKQFPVLNPIGIEAANDLDAQLFQTRSKSLNQWEKTLEECRVSCSDVKQAINLLNDFKNCLKQSSNEPQRSIPDIILQVEFSKKRVAFARIPAHDVLYSPDSKQYCGRMCGMSSTVVLQYPENANHYRKRPNVACQLQATLWLGLLEHEAEYVKSFTASTHASLAVYAETFEEKKGLRQQTTFSPFSISDSNLSCPLGWKWKTDWKFVKGPLSDRSLNLTKTQEVYEEQTRSHGDWSKDSFFTDEDHNKFKGMHEIRCEKNWAVKSDWELDLNGRKPDGWEYSSVTNHPIWLLQQQHDSKKRRRRWLREIKFVDLLEQVKIERNERESEKGWIKFQDGSSKRRWIRPMEHDSDDANTFTFQFDNADMNSPSSGSGVTFQPRISMDFEKSMKLEMRVYIYQARDLLPVSKQSYAKHTPFVYAFFMTQGVRTRKKDMREIRKMNPCWNQTLQLEMEYYGDMYQLKRRPPPILLHIYVKNDYGKFAWLGEAKVEAILQIEMANRTAPVLTWCPVLRGRQEGGAILVAAEVFTVVKGKAIPKMTSNIPVEIAPQMAKYHLDMMLLGVRDIKPSRFRRVKKLSVVIAVGDMEITSDVIKDSDTSPNFSRRRYCNELNLPAERKFWPPIIIRMKDHQFFGVRPTIGEHVIHDISAFMKPAITNQSDQIEGLDKSLPARQEEVAIDVCHESDTTSLTSDRDIVDWWSKYNSSVESIKIAKGQKAIDDTSEECQQYLSCGLDTLDIYRAELEEQNFDSFSDVIRSFPIYAGREDVDDEARDAIGELKGQICIHKMDKKGGNVEPHFNVDSLDEIIDMKVRVYIVKAYDLAPKDRNGLSDPYVLVSAGTKKAGDRSDYRANSLNPVFGQVLELDLTIPFEKTLRIEVYDWDAIGKDDKIGETTIDLENRFHSKFWAWFGLPKTYCNKGLNKWRLQQTPKSLLQIRATLMKIEAPSWNGSNAVSFNKKKYLLSDFENDLKTCADWGPADERLALYVLQEYPHVTEHVETRSIFSNTIPGIPQGRLELWVDMFPKKYGEPGPPENITPREPKNYCVRVVVWNCSDIPFADVSILGERMTDIYVKGWLEGMHSKKQKTDTHYRSLDGSGMFNWRFVFPFQYISQEKMLVVTKREHFWNIDETSSKYEPILHIQVWDEDLLTPNDYLGEIAIPLNKVPSCSKTASSANLKLLPSFDGKSVSKTHDLFEIKVVNGWWPLYRIKNGERTEAGKIELAIEVVSEEEHQERKAGKGRGEPNEHPKLLKPDRPKTSFAWFTSPFKSIRYILWRRYRWKIIIILIVLPILVFLILLIYTAPSSINTAIIHAGKRK